MDYQDLRTLKLLEEIERAGAPSQRDLAKKLNISLGLVNSFIKRLAQKGYFKVKTIPKNRVKYILTPKGVAEKTQLTYEYIQDSYRFYKEARRKLRDLFSDLQRQGVCKIAFCGTGDFAEIAFLSLQGTSLELVAIGDGQNSGDRFFGYEVLSYPTLLQSAFDRILITAVDRRKQMVEQLDNHDVDCKKIVLLC